VPLVLGTVVSNNVSAAQSVSYTFTLAAPSRLIFDSLTSNNQIQWSLTAGNGANFVSNRSFQSSDSIDFADASLALPAGQYQLTVNGTVAATNSFQFRLLNFASATVFTPGTLVTNSLTPANSTVFYQFNGNAGDRYYFDGRPTSGFAYTPYCRLYGPLGNVVQGSFGSSSDVDTFTLPQTGTYTLTVEGRVFDPNSSGNYSFNLVPDPVVPPQPIFTTNVSPDLIVSTITVTPSSGLQSGGSA